MTCSSDSCRHTLNDEFVLFYDGLALFSSFAVVVEFFLLYHPCVIETKLSSKF